MGVAEGGERDARPNALSIMSQVYSVRRSVAGTGQRGRGPVARHRCRREDAAAVAAGGMVTVWAVTGMDANAASASTKATNAGAPPKAESSC